MTPAQTPQTVLTRSPGMAVANPFDPGEVDAYRHWRDAYLDQIGACSRDRVTMVEDLANPGESELAQIIETVARHGFAFYRTSNLVSGKELAEFGRALGLARFDPGVAGESGVRHLKDLGQTARAGADYIPFTRRALNWHTDGYYNEPGAPVRAFTMHCVRPADRGGENSFLDPRRVYIALRDENPDWVAALSSPAALTIPPNEQDGVTLRPARSGPVFSQVSEGSQTLIMRYTIRKRHVEWQNSPVVQTAKDRLRELLETDQLGATRRRLRSGEGVVCANVLHTRSAFEDDGEPGRHMLRARYLDAIAR